MSDPDDRRAFPHSKDELVRDVALLGRLKDIRDAALMEEVLAPKWWEAAVGLVQFASAIGLLGGLIYYAAKRDDLQLRVLTFFFALLVLSLIFAFEFMIFKIHHLRRANQITRRQLDDVQRRIDAIEKAPAIEPRNE